MITIIGAGISGLTLAYFLQKNNVPYRLLEANSEVGGYIRSVRKGNYLIELGPNSLLIDSEILSYLNELNLQSEIVYANEVSKARYIFKKGKYRKLPSKPPELLWNTFFSLKTKFAIYQELKKPAEDYPDETLSHFFARRFNQEIVDYALAPFIAGIYAGNADDLLVHKTFPFLKEYEQKYGSIIKGMMKNKSAERKQTVNFKNGMASLPQAIAKQLVSLELNHSVRKVELTDNQTIIHTDKKRFETTKVVFATPSKVVAKLLSHHTDWVDALANIYYPPMVAIHTTYPKAQVKFPLNGFGALHPQVEHLFATGNIWSSSIFDGRCPKDEVMFTTFVGGSHQEAKIKFIEKIGALVHQELSKLYQISAEPLFQSIFKWDEAIPQYDKNMIQAHKVVDEMQKHHLYVCANWKDGVSLSDCIKKAKNLANSLSDTIM
jgi:oxygen-dependent protoporphyrinogen oxidase